MGALAVELGWPKHSCTKGDKRARQVIVALILAGGQSRRMGFDKALMAWNGEPLIQRTCRVALGCAARVYVVTPWADRYRPVLPPR